MKIRKILSYFLLISLFGCCALSYSLPISETIQSPELIQPSEPVLEEALPSELIVNLYIDPKFTDLERKLIESAMEEWYIQAYPVINYHIMEENDIIIENALLIIKGSSKDPEIKAMGADDLLGFYSGSFNLPVIVLLTDNIKNSHEPNMFFETTLHEMGHAWGLDHLSDDYLCLMYPYAHVQIDKLVLKAGSIHITETDMTYFCSLYQCL